MTETRKDTLYVIWKEYCHSLNSGKVKLRWVHIAFQDKYILDAKIIGQALSILLVDEIAHFVDANWPLTSFSREDPPNPSSKVLYMSSSFWLLGVESRDFSHAEKETKMVIGFRFE